MDKILLTRNAKYFKIREDSTIQFIGKWEEWKARKELADRAQYLFEQYFHWRRRTKYFFTFEIIFNSPVAKNTYKIVDYSLIIHIKRKD